MTADLVWQRLADRLDPTPSPYKADPVRWAHEKLGTFVIEQQAAIMRSVAANRYTAVPSCHDIGKSFTAGELACWWIDVHAPGEAFVVTTAPTAAQVGAILWREIGKMHRKGDLLGYITGNNEWKIGHGGSAPEVIAYGRKPADYDPTAFQGIHARFVLVIIDESCGIPEMLYNAVDSLVTNAHARVLAIGNPDDPASHFKKICEPGSGWNVVRCDALRSPNMTASALREHKHLRAYMIRHGIPPSTEQVPDELRELLISPEWVEERLKRWGENSPLFVSKVRGEFPTVAIDTLIHPHWVTLAQARDYPHPSNVGARLGVDVARYGTDHSIIMRRRGGECRVIKEISYGPVTEVAGYVVKIGSEFLPGLLPLAMVDDVGVGGGVTDILAEQGYPVVPIIGGARCTQILPNGQPKFINKRSELWWNLREALAGPTGDGSEGWLDLDPDDDELAAQLVNIKYKINSKGQIKVESKEEMKARGLSSPDRGDALAYAAAPDELASTPVVSTEDMLTGDLLTRRM